MRTTKYALPLFFMVVKTNVNYQVHHRLVYHGIHIIQAYFPSSIYQYFNVECALPQTKKTKKHEKRRGGLGGWGQ